MYRFGGLSVVISGSGSAVGSASFGGGFSASASLSAIFNNPSVSFPWSLSGSSPRASFSSTQFSLNSFSINTEVYGKLDLSLSLSGWVDGNFEIDLSGYANYQYSRTGYYSQVNVAPILSLRKLQSTNEDLVSFKAGSKLSIQFSYDNFVANEKIVLLYSIESADVKTNIMMKQFNTSSTGSGRLDAIWTVPWYSRF